MSQLIAMPLDVFARNGQWLEVRVPWVKVTLWVVPEERDAETLGGEGVHRGRVWTARELIGVMAITGRSEALPSITLAKIRFDGDIAEAITEKGERKNSKARSLGPTFPPYPLPQATSAPLESEGQASGQGDDPRRCSEGRRSVETVPS
jgi:hypothetical protein